MANFDVYQVVDKGVLQGQECLNVYFFQVQDIATAHNAAEVTAAYIAQTLPLVKTMQESGFVHTEVKATNLFDPSDVHTEAISVPGTAAFGADLLPIFAAVGFTEVGANGAVRNGSKRYSGLDEGIQVDGTITNGTFITQANLVADQLFNPLTVGILDVFIPIIIKRLLVGSDYVLPDNLADAVVSQIVDATFHALLTSQVSRKVGSGS